MPPPTVHSPPRALTSSPQAMTERLLRVRAKGMPVCIVRPSIVSASWSEPAPGWIDSVSALSAVVLTCALGVVTILPIRARHVADIIPVDHVVSILLVSAFVHADSTRCPVSGCAGAVVHGLRGWAGLVCSDLLVFHGGRLQIVHACTSGGADPMLWRTVISEAKRNLLKEGPPAKAIFPPHVTTCVTVVARASTAVPKKAVLALTRPPWPGLRTRSCSRRTGTFVTNSRSPPSPPGLLCPATATRCATPESCGAWCVLQGGQAYSVCAGHVTR